MKLPRRTPRTPLYGALRHQWQTAQLTTHRTGNGLTRRDFLKLGTLATAGGLLGLPRGIALPRRQSPRVAIVGAGIAGLNAAYTLKKTGINAAIYEGSLRVGGRMFTTKGVLAPDLLTDLGGEFIDSVHDDMLGLVQEFGLELIDRTALEDQGLAEGYFFGGQHYTTAQVIEALQPLAAQIDQDIASLDEDDSAIATFDQLSIAQYLDQIGVTSGWLRDLLDVAFVTENGLSIEEQSALNFLWLAPTIEGESLTMFGASDERYTIKGGSGHLIDQLAAALDGQIETSKLLEAIRGEADGSFTLSFGDGTSVQADYVIVAIPLTLLRQIDLRLDLPPLQRQGINELGYGTNAKVLAGFDQRVWYDQGATGEVFTDEAFQLAWDNSVGQDSTAGGITFYSGGQPGLDVGDGSPEDQAARLMAGFERVFPGVTSHHNGKVLRMHWPSYAFALGSYSCPTVGQYSTFFADISQPVGHLFFAGEHCSDAYWGFMNGGAESGRVAAENLLAAL